MEAQPNHRMFPSQLPGNPVSLWMGTTPGTDFPALAKDMEVEAVVVGAGITGLTTAHLLNKAGVRTAVIDMGRIVTGVTGNTTAKITSLHELIYAYLIQTFGREGAQIYADANQTALEKMAALIQSEQIDCDFHCAAAYTYTTSTHRLPEVEAEVAAAQRLGLPASFETETELPFPVKGAVCFKNQAHFHPRKYLLALADRLAVAGVEIYENTRALAVQKGKTAAVVTENGTVRAKHVIVATNFPFYDPALYFARMHPKRSYVLGMRLNQPCPEGMYISVEEPFHSLRRQPLAEGEMLLVGGQNHKTGHGGNTAARYRKLEAFARDHFDVASIEYRWSTQDNVTVEKIPYIGRPSPLHSNIYSATGFAGWGMTHSMVAAIILSDAVIGHDNPWSSFYSPLRFKPSRAPAFIRQNLDVARSFVMDHLIAPDDLDTARLAPGEGGVIRVHGKHTGVGKDRQDNLHVVSPVCTHLGCNVRWNAAETSWDCPCHGSRFAADGRVIHGPAIKDLAKRSLEKDRE